MPLLDLLDIVTNLDRIRLDKKESVKDIILISIAVLIFLGAVAIFIVHPEYYQNSDDSLLPTLLISAIISFLICFVLYKINILLQVRLATFVIFLLSLMLVSFTLIRHLALL